MTAPPGKVLVVGPSWVGDMVISQALYRYLAASRPGVVIDVLAPAWSAPLLARMPEVREAIDMPLGHGDLGLGRRRRLGHALRERGYEQAIVLPNSFKSALLPWIARIPVRSGWRGEMRYGLLNDLRVLDRAALPGLAARFAALGAPRDGPAPAPPRPALRVEPARAHRVAREYGLAPRPPLLALCPGAEFGAAKRWPPQHYAELARHYLRRGWQVALFGSAADGPACAAVSAACDAPRALTDLSGRTSLAEAIDLLSVAALIVSNDSGLMHVGAALGRPVLGLYGPTSPLFPPPLHPRAAVLASDIDCAPCFARDCPLGHQRCLRDLQPGAVIERLAALEEVAV